MHIGVEFMLDKRTRCLGVHVLAEDVSRVGGIGSPSKYPRLSYPMYLLLFNLNRQITFHGAQRVAVCNHRDMKKSSNTFIVTPRGIFLHVISDYSLTFFLPYKQSKFDARAVPHHTT